MPKGDASGCCDDVEGVLGPPAVQVEGAVVVVVVVAAAAAAVVVAVVAWGDVSMGKWRSGQSWAGGHAHKGKHTALTSVPLPTRGLMHSGPPTSDLPEGACMAATRAIAATHPFVNWTYSSRRRQLALSVS